MLNSQKGFLFVIFILSCIEIFSQEYKVIDSGENFLTIQFDFSNKFIVKDFLIDGIKFTKIIDHNIPLQIPGNPFLPTKFYKIGVPLNSVIKLEILKVDSDTLADKFIMSTPDSGNQPLSLLNYNSDIYSSSKCFPFVPASIDNDGIFRYIRFISLYISPYQFNPLKRQLIFNKIITIKIEFQRGPNENFIKTSDRVTDDFILKNVINPEQALKFSGKTEVSVDSPQSNRWYDPNKEYYKIYLNKDGIFRISYDFLVSIGINPSSGLQDGKLELYNYGHRIPLDIFDQNSDGFFNSGDYFQFVGNKVQPSPFSGLNIYNLTNLYWFSYQADSVLTYKSINGYPNNFNNLIISSIETVHWEQDKIYDHFGYAPNDQRDYWNWQTLEVRNNHPFTYFSEYFKDSIAYHRDISRKQGKMRVNLHGLTSSGCPNAHNAWVKFNFTKIGNTLSWSGQNSATIEGDFIFGFGGDSVYCSPDSNYVIVGLDSTTCNPSGADVVRLNWIELDYWRLHQMDNRFLKFKSPPNNFSENNYYLYRYYGSNLRIYIPERSEMILNAFIKNDIDRSVYFTDTVSLQTEYYCADENYYLAVDSIKLDEPSDLRNLQNSADYIIITPRTFISSANRLAEFRSNNLKGILNPRIKIIYVDDIFDEFSDGLLDPQALKSFVQYAFENWEAPAPYYIALLGDMSSDYRKIFETSRDNFIPSIPYHSQTYGQAPSDNSIVTVSGNDLIPDLAIGRISCESVDEADILIDKIINYPANIDKNWKQNVLLLSSGISAEDENQFKFNDRNMVLENNFLIPAGIKSSKVFRYPNKTEYLPFQGEGPEIRNEINNGAVIVNYYGHGGGYQWDLVFTNDDIVALENGQKLPFVVSVTCYTAHYDNQEIFGEIFNSIEGKGSIAFFGSSGVTFWPTTAIFNQDMFTDLFNNRDYVIGNAINSAKSNQQYASMIPILTLLGDPALELAIPYYPDFVLKPSDITFSKENPIVNDSIIVFISLKNVGRSFSGDSVVVRLFENIKSDSTAIAYRKVSSFGEEVEHEFLWIPKHSGLNKIIADINEVESIYELDHNDNSVSKDIPVFSIGEPNILKPLDNFFTTASYMDFLIIDIGEYIQKSFSFRIEVDTSRFFNSPSKLISPLLFSDGGIVKWRLTNLLKDEYFWKAFIYSDVDTNSSISRTFSITDTVGHGYLVHKNQLESLTNNNMYYSDRFEALLVNSDLLPPRPSDTNLIDSVLIFLPADTTQMTSFATDGTYFYFGDLSYYRPDKLSSIYRVGTGENGTIKGLYYGTVGNFKVQIKNQIFYHSDGFLYVATGDDSTLLKIHPVTGDTSRVILGGKLLPTEDGLLKNGGYYLASDGRFVYNLTPGYGNIRKKYTLRTFDPLNNWQTIEPDIEFIGNSEAGFSNFFVVGDNVFTAESFYNQYMRRYKKNGFFEEEWLTLKRPNILYAWTYDWSNDVVFASTFKPIQFYYQPAFFKFNGRYHDAKADCESNEMGPASQWQNLKYKVDKQNSNGRFNATLKGLNYYSKSWDTLKINVPEFYNLSYLNASTYPKLKLEFTFVDSSFGNSEPLKFKYLKSEFKSYPEVHLFTDQLIFSSDTLLQGSDNEMTLKIKNLGDAASDSLLLEYYFNISDSIVFKDIVNIPADSTIEIHKVIKTEKLLYSAPLSPIDIKVIATPHNQEFFTFNNLTDGWFNVSRDSIRPNFTITFDGNELIDGDVISSEPEVIMSLEDNSPLPLSPNLFSIQHNNETLNFYNPSDSLSWDYTPYPSSKATVKWRPKLQDGLHTLSVFVKDSSGNPFNTTQSVFRFYVYNNPDLVQVYNYPNPFKDKTEFTFEVRGILAPEEVKIKVFSVAGRLIRELIIPGSDLQIGFNRIAWDGKDQDGDEIANGVYFYKLISKHGDETKVTTQKLAKLK
jgi:hypothetical protein